MSMYIPLYRYGVGLNITGVVDVGKGGLVKGFEVVVHDSITTGSFVHSFPFLIALAGLVKYLMACAVGVMGSCYYQHMT